MQNWIFQSTGFFFCSVSGDCQINYCHPFLWLHLSLNSCTYIILCRANFIMGIWNYWDNLQYKHSKSVLKSQQILIHSREAHYTDNQCRAEGKHQKFWNMGTSGFYLYIIRFSFQHYNMASEIIWSIAALWPVYKKLPSSYLLFYFLKGLLDSCFL